MALIKECRRFDFRFEINSAQVNVGNVKNEVEKMLID